MQIEYIRSENVGKIVLSNPPYNALTHPVFADAEELRAFLADESLKVGLICGQGNNFCAGADPDALGKHMKEPKSLGRQLDRGKELLEVIRSATIPMIASITGSCLGAGLEIALACHFRFAANSAMFGLPEAGLGLLPGFGAPVFSNGIVSRGVLVDLILTGRLVGAEEARSLGLVDRTAPGKELDIAVAGFIESLTGKRNPAQIRAVMTSIHNADRYPIDQALRLETELFCKLAADRD